MREWLKMLIGGICVLTILLNLIPEGKFAKYVRFYAGLIFFLMASSPVLRFFSGEGELERLLQLEFLREDYYDLESAVNGMSDLKNDQIRVAYQQEILRQMEEIAAAYGIADADIEVSFDRTDGYTLSGVEIRARMGTGKEAENGAVSWKNRSGEDTASDGEMTEQELSVAAQNIRQEISSVYGLEINRISITGQGGRQM